MVMESKTDDRTSVPFWPRVTYTVGHMGEKALSVSEFLASVNIAFEEVYPAGVVIEGEVVEYKVSQGKWIWFSLKDEMGLLSCFATVWQLKTPLEDGMQVRVHGVPKLYPKNGRFSLTVDRAEPVGEGALQRAFELMKKKLEAEGVFAPERKRSLPRFPERIGLIASTESAAYTDFLRILGNRWGGLHVKSAHVQVQGKDAVADITGAFAWFNAHADEADVLVLTRGGGSLEDLHAFNSEEVARAVFSSKIPVVVGVGHERDESLADYAADFRASTPSNAAETLVPDRRDMALRVESFASAIESSLRESLSKREHRLHAFEERLAERVRAERLRLDMLVGRLRGRFSDWCAEVSGLSVRTAHASGLLQARFESALRSASDSLARNLRLLKSLDPQAVLKRGYGIVRCSGGGILRDASKVDVGETVHVQLHAGALDAQVTEIRK